MWISKAHYALIARWQSEASAHSESLLRATREQMAHLEARTAQLETERRELIDRLFAREDARNAPLEPMPPPVDTWQAQMQEQIREQYRVEQ